MSYMHYWGRPAELSRGSFERFAGECKQLRLRLGVPRFGLFGGVKIGGAMGPGEPTFSSECICFNGRPSHETFLIHRAFHHPEREAGDFGLHWDFVATDRKPYDDLVVAVLLSFKHAFPGAALSSDGGEEAWARGVALYERTTGRSVPSLRDLATPRPE